MKSLTGKVDIQERARILLKLCEVNTSSKSLNTHILMCSKEILGIVKVLENCCSIIEVTECNKGCPPLTKKIFAKAFHRDVLVDPNARVRMAEECFLPNNPCSKDTCNGVQQSAIKEVGKDFILLLTCERTFQFLNFVELRIDMSVTVRRLLIFRL